MRLRLLLSLVFALCLFASGASKAQDLPSGEASPKPAAEPARPQVTSAPSSDYVIGGGDVLEIKVFKQPDLSGRYRVSETGNIEMIFVGRQNVAGLTESEATELLRQQLLKYLRQPEVSVSVAEFNSQLVTIVGAVRTPGRFPLRRSVRVLDAVALAGGLVENSGRFIYLFRRSAKPRDVDLTGSVPSGPEAEPEVEVELVNVDDVLSGKSGANVALSPGDTLSVPKADVVFVTGNVRKPGEFQARNPVTITQAVGLASGFADAAKKNDMILYRYIPGKAEREAVKVSIADIQSGKQKDLIMQANDVLFVPNSEAKNIGLTIARNLPTIVAASLLPILVR
jgi:polysaccharide export outer membrane protein